MITGSKGTNNCKNVDKIFQNKSFEGIYGFLIRRVYEEVKRFNGTAVLKSIY